MNLRIESTDSQASILERRLTELDPNISYQEEQHGPILLVCLGFESEQENVVRRIIGEIGLQVRGDSDEVNA